jgi:hypothetical protein
MEGGELLLSRDLFTADRCLLNPNWLSFVEPNGRHMSAKS